MSIVGLDSAFAPSAAQAQAARAGGVRLWSGYLATEPNVGLYHPWSQADFENARLCGSTPIAFCAGWDDPVACRALASTWNVRLCLDVEGGIRPDGSWVQGWLDRSGAGLYGVAAVHAGRQAAFHVLAWYTANAGATWAGQRPGSPCGWQWQNSHNEFGVTVDRGWYDDWFLGSTTATAVSEVQVMATIDDVMSYVKAINEVTLLRMEGEIKAINEVTLLRMEGEIKALQASVAALQPAAGPAGPPGPAGPTGPAGASPTDFTITGTAKAV